MRKVKESERAQLLLSLFRYYKLNKFLTKTDVMIMEDKELNKRLAKIPDMDKNGDPI